MPHPILRPTVRSAFRPLHHLRYASTATPSKPTSAFSPLRLARLALVGALGGHIINTYFFSIDTTWGISMLPLIAADGDVLVVSKYYRRGRGVGVGDLVSFRHPADERTQALKRVIGMEGDFVLREAPHRGKGDMIQVPEGHCYVVGDNLDHSRDSRLYGPLPMALIKGKAIYKINRNRFWLFPWPEAIGEGLQEPMRMEEE